MAHIYICLVNTLTVSNYATHRYLQSKTISIVKMLSLFEMIETFETRDFDIYFTQTSIYI